MLTFGSLFSGIGGLDLGLERAGMRCVWQSEIEPYACRVLAKHWPDVPNLGDVNHVDWSTVPAADVICGGYPCQPFSVAGRRNGADDARHLWPMFARAISVVRPRYALLENVTGHLSLGFGQVLADLAALRYDTRWDCIPAGAIGAPHLRDRVFIIATRSDIADTNNTSGQRGGIPGRRQTQRTIPHFPTIKRPHWETQPGVDRMDDGIPNRLDRLRGLGNAVIPQVAEHVANIILSYET